MDKTTKNSNIVMGSVKRLTAELKHYKTEQTTLETEVMSFQNVAKASEAYFKAKKATEMLEETILVIRDTKQRLNKSLIQLKEILLDESAISDNNSKDKAIQILNDAQQLLSA